ncbi:MAG: ribosome small subunit-dependent GTPase A [Anaerolineae bacterium]|nr:ribosome small subunit-dependent GTPase A [Anaerolineae bacterium]
MELERGIVLRSQSGFYDLETEGGERVTARLRGRVKRGPKTGDLVAVGDWVRFSRPGETEVMIEEVEERRTQLSRMSPNPSGEYEQIIMANLDQAVFVFACADPAPRLRMLDRFLVIAERQEIPAVIVANKIDLVSRNRSKELFGHYPQIGYPVLYTSATKSKGLGALRKQLAGKVSALTGPSGVGKSLLLNKLEPELDLDVSEVSKTTGKGRHTTVVREMFALSGKDNGYVADTPGLKALALWDIEPEELDGYFPELYPLVPECRFSSCTHTEEPGCAVLEAVEAGEVSPERYESYIRLRLGELD